MINVVLDRIFWSLLYWKLGYAMLKSKDVYK